MIPQKYRESKLLLKIYEKILLEVMLMYNERIRELRKEKNITQKMLGEILNVADNTITEWEKGRTEPSISSITALADFFQCSTDFLLGREDYMGNITTINQSLQDSEIKLLDYWNKLNRSGQNRAVGFILGLLENQAYLKGN